jgi:hypothetical protein
MAWSKTMFLPVPRRPFSFILYLIIGLTAFVGWFISIAKKPSFDEIVYQSDQKSHYTSKSDSSIKARINETYGKLPLSFEVNQGQVDEQVKFLSRSNGYNLFLTPTEAVLALRKASVKEDQNGRFGPQQSAKEEAEAAVVHMQLVGANPEPQVSGVDELPGKSNYFIGNDPAKWQTDISHYAKVRYENVYPGIDLVYYGNQQQLEYDFVVASGADPKTIIMQFEGVEDLELDPNGDLLLHTLTGVVRKQRPIVYQEVDGNKHIISGDYQIKGKGRIGFQVTGYDLRRELIIDPVLIYSTYLGGGVESKFMGDMGNDIVVDTLGNAYVVGTTTSTDFPSISGTFQTKGNTFDAFVAKLTPDGTIDFSSYLGGNGGDRGNAIAIDTSGNCYLTGFTASTDFPTINPMQPTNKGVGNVFITKLASTGSALIFSTYVGGQSLDEGTGITLDSNRNIYFSGTTLSPDFPTVNAIQANKSGSSDGFISKLNAVGDKLIYSTYIGGSIEESVYDIAIDSDTNVYIVGSTSSSNFPLVNPIQANKIGTDTTFISKLNSLGNTLIYSTYLGGKDGDSTIGYGITVDNDGNAYITGITNSKTFPITNGAYQPLMGGFADAFVTKINPVGNAIIYSTYLGGNETDIGYSIAVDSVGNAYITGTTRSTNFPIVLPLQGSISEGICNGIPCSDIFVTKLNSIGSVPSYSTYLGGRGFDEIPSIAIDNSGNAYLTGHTLSNNFPTVNPFQSALKGEIDAFVTKISDTPLPSFTLDIIPGVQTISAGTSGSFTIFVQSVNGFNQPVNLVATVAPANTDITTNLTSTIVSPGRSSNLTVSTSPTTTLGSYNITITGTAGQLVRTSTVTLVVKEIPDFSLIFSPSTINVSRGQSGIFTVNIIRVGGFTGNVTVTAPDTKPLKIKLTPPVQSTTGTSVSFNFKVKKKAPVGAKQLTFVGQDNTGRTRTGTLTLIVQ